jgi:hypothetical protein
MIKRLSLCRTSGSLDYGKCDAAAWHNGVVQYANKLITTYALVHFGRGQGRLETQPLEDCLTLSDRLVHGYSSVWVACIRQHSAYLLVAV